MAIAAVSGNTAPSNVLVIGSELLAPAIFLCLVYFAGRVITSSWPHLLTAGVLASSTGQLLIRHFAAPDVACSDLAVAAARRALEAADCDPQAIDLIIVASSTPDHFGSFPSTACVVQRKLEITNGCAAVPSVVAGWLGYSEPGIELGFAASSRTSA